MKRGEVIKIFRALGNERRFLIARHILENEEMNVSRISEFINLSLKSTSRHLSVLKNANVVTSRQKDVNIFYSINKDFIKEFLKFLK